jgi:FkbM family methyltransferase
MAERDVVTQFGKFRVELSNDFYGNAFWEKIESGAYEPDTMSFLQNFVNDKSDFIDAGVANGAISIISALQGARVLGYEAMPGICSVAIKNIELSKMNSVVEIRNRAISNHEGIMSLAYESDPTILSSITFSSHEDQEVKIHVDSLSRVINQFHDSTRNLIIKIDIEGAEWKLLSDYQTIETLRAHKAVVLLAIHPGFHRPFRKLPLGLTFISKYLWHIRNAIECIQIFKSVASNGRILRTNLDLVRSPKRVVALMFGGCHEFILDFR